MTETVIHPTAVIAPGAALGVGVTVGPFCIIEDDVTIGDGCILDPHSVIRQHTAMGANCHIHPGAIIGDIPQDLSFKGGASYVKIGAHCVMREHVTVHRGTEEGSVTEIGEHCFFMACSHMGHNVKVGNRVIMANSSAVGGHAEIDDGVFISANVGVHQFVKVGRLAMIGAGSQATKDVPPFCTIHSSTMNLIAGLNIVGLRRAGYSSDERKAIKKAYTLLFKSGLNVTQAVAEIKKQCPPGPAHEFCDFVERSARGICTMKC
jgi:UDP-N-acetylglucosamine acyltransferase